MAAFHTAVAQGPVLPPRPPVALAPLPALAPMAQPWESNFVGRVPPRAELPTAVFLSKGWPAETTRQHALPARPATDRPRVAWDLGPYPARPYLPPAGPPSYAPSPDPARLVAPWREIGPDADPATAATDPVLHPVRSVSLAGIPEMKQKPAPFLRMNVPDPYEQTAPLRLRAPPPETEGPAASSDLPPKPFLPVLPAKP